MSSKGISVPSVASGALRRKRVRPNEEVPPAVAALREGLTHQVGQALSSPSLRAFNRTVDEIGFEALWRLLSGAPWAEPYVSHLMEVAQARLQTDKTLTGQNLLANVYGKESLRSLGAGTVVVMDLNGYSNFQNSVSQTLRQKLDQHMQEILFALGKEFGVSMLQMPAEINMRFLEKTEDTSFDIERLAAFLAHIKVKISTGIAPKMRRYGLNLELYPDGNFTFSTEFKR